MGAGRQRIWIHLDEAQPREAAALKVWRAMQSNLADTLRASIMREIVVAGLEKVSRDLSDGPNIGELRSMIALGVGVSGALPGDPAPRRRGRPPIGSRGHRATDHGGIGPVPLSESDTKASGTRKSELPTCPIQEIGGFAKISDNPDFGHSGNPMRPDLPLPEINPGSIEIMPTDERTSIEPNNLEAPGSPAGQRPRLGLSMW